LVGKIHECLSVSGRIISLTEVGYKDMNCIKMTQVVANGSLYSGDKLGVKLNFFWSVEYQLLKTDSVRCSKQEVLYISFHC
jgi:hypothetical protein